MGMTNEVGFLKSDKRQVLVNLSLSPTGSAISGTDLSHLINGI